MLNKTLIHITDMASFLLKTVNLDKQIRRNNDIRLVFYHGIGDKVSKCMKYLDDEIPQHVFESHIDYLQDKYTLLSLKDIVELSESDDISAEKPLCNISFDDGLHSVYSCAFPILKEKGVPFDVFINTSSTNNKDLLWLHSLNYLLTTYGPETIANEINILIDTNDEPKVHPSASNIERWARDNFEFFFESDIIRKLYEKYGISLEDIAAQQNLYLNWDQIDEMKTHGVGFYSHTHRHFPLNCLSREELIKSEIQKALDIIRTHQQSDQFISFPFGMEIDYGKRAIKHALEAGHGYIVEVGDGINSPHRIKNKRIMSRVGLGSVGSSASSIYAAIELRPVVKKTLKKLLRNGS